MTDGKRESMGPRARGATVAGIAVLVAGASLLAALDPAPSLGAARGFAVLAGSTVTNVGDTVVTGDVGVSPGTAITGFPPGIVQGGTLHAGDAAAAAAQVDAALAFAELAGMPGAVDLSGQDLGGLTLGAGVYAFSSSAQLTGSLVLDAACDEDALFVFQIGTTLTTAANATVSVIHGGLDFDESRIYWQVGSSATLGADTLFAGIIVAQTSIGVGTGAIVDGNLLALDGAVTLSGNEVVSPPVVVDDSTVEFTTTWAHVTDTKGAVQDQFRLTGTYAFVASPDGVLDPATDGISISVTVLGELAARSLAIPAGDPLWKVTNAGTKFNWAGIGADGERWTVELDDALHTFNIWANLFELNPGDGAGANWGPVNAGYVVPVDLEIATGNDSGHDHACFRNSLTFNATKNWGVLRIP